MESAFSATTANHTQQRGTKPSLRICTRESWVIQTAPATGQQHLLTALTCTLLWSQARQKWQLTRQKEEFHNFVGVGNNLTHKPTIPSFYPLGLQQLHRAPAVMAVTATEPCCQFSKRLTTALAYASKGIVQQPKAKLLLPSSFSKTSDLWVFFPPYNPCSPVMLSTFQKHTKHCLSQPAVSFLHLPRQPWMGIALAGSKCNRPGVESVWQQTLTKCFTQ